MQKSRIGIQETGVFRVGRKEDGFMDVKDNADFEVFYETYFPQVVGYIRKRVGNLDTAEDMAEDEEVLDRIRFWRWSLKYIRLMLYAKDMEEQELMVKFADFFQNMKYFGIGSVMEGGRYESSVGRMWKLIQENLKA